MPGRFSAPRKVLNSVGPGQQKHCDTKRREAPADNPAIGIGKVGQEWQLGIDIGRAAAKNAGNQKQQAETTHGLPPQIRR